MKKLLMTFGVGAALAAGAATINDAQKLELEFRLPRVRQAPVIDGTIGADEWREATEVRQFPYLGKDLAMNCASAYLWCVDDENFYFAARCQSPAGGLRQRVKPQGSSQFDAIFEDGFEFVFIRDVNAAKPDIAHFIVNTVGAWYGEGMSKGGMCSAKPDGYTCRTVEKDGFFTYEMSIPLKTILFDGEGQHGVKIAQNWLGNPVRDVFVTRTCLMPKCWGYFSATDAAAVTFDDEAPSVQVKACGETPVEKAMPVVVRLADVSGKGGKYKVQILGRPDRSQPGGLDKEVELAAGGEETLSADIAIQGDEEIDLRIAVTSLNGAKTHYLRHFKVAPNRPLGKLFLGAAAKAKTVDMRFAYYPSYDKVRVSAKVDRGEVKSAKTAKFSVLDSKGGELMAKELPISEKGEIEAIVEVPDLKAATKQSGNGEYLAVLEVSGVKDARDEQKFYREVFAWEGNRIGLSGAVPAPFKPIMREQGTGNREQEKVSVVLRDHIVDRKTGLWEQVTAAGKDLLARPMRFVSASKTCSLFPVPCSLSTSSTWDIDGLMTWHLTLKPGHYEPMALEIPIKAERAKLMHACTDGLRFNYAGEVAAGMGRVWDSTKASRSGIIGDYVPYVWVGGPLRGIAVFGNNDKGWIIGDNVPCQEIVREADGTVTIRLNLVQRACDLTEERTIKIGFMATPVKPMPENWREIPADTFLGCCLYWGGYEDSHDLSPYDEKTEFWEKMAEARRTGKVDHEFLSRFCRNYDTGYPKDSDKHKELYKRATAHFGAGMGQAKGDFGVGRPFTWYTNGRGVHFYKPSGRTFCDEWDCREFMQRQFDIRWMTAYSVDPVPSFLDYAAWWWAKAFKSGALDHLYWDNVFLVGNKDLVGTDAYVTPSGAIQADCGIFKMREQVKRGFMTAAECGKDPTGNWIHMTNTQMAPISAFAGVCYDWEDPGSSAPFQERYSRAYIQALSLGRQVGCRTKVIGYCQPTTPEKRALFDRAGVGVTLTHELGWKRPEPVQKALKDFGYGVAGSGVKVWNYWDEDVPFPAAIDGIEWSALAMSNPKGEAMIVVSDWKDGGTVRVKPDCAALGIGASFSVVNAETGAELPVKDGIVTVTLTKYDYILIRLKGL